MSNRRLLVLSTCFIIGLALIWVISGIDTTIHDAPLSQPASGAPSSENSPTAGQPPAGDNQAFDFTASDLRGRKFALNHWRGHPVVVDFWATWCGPCRRQVPELESLFEKYRQSRGLVVVGVSCDTVRDGTTGDVEGFVKDFGISYPILLGDSALVDSLGVEAIPTTYFVDEHGQIVDRIIGAGQPGELAREVESLLAHRGAPRQSPSAPRAPSDKSGHWVNIGWFHRD